MKSENQLDMIQVMVVDDEKNIRDGSERILTRMGFKVHKAQRGDVALEILNNETISIVFLDLKMPGMDGMEVLSRIRNIDESIMVIVITGYATVETATSAMKQGAYDFISKPFEPDQLRIVAGRAREKILLTGEAKKLAQERKRTLLDLDTEKSRIHTIIDSLPAGVVVTNAKGQVVLMNPAFRRYFSIDLNQGPGKHIESCIPDKRLCKLIMEISQGKHIDYEDIPIYEFSLSDKQFLQARCQPVMGEKKECLGAVVNFTDITTIKLLDRLKSEFVTKVSHELRSPLSTIHEQLALVIRDMVEETTEQDQYLLTRAKEKTKGLISLIGDLLDLSRIEEGIICHDPKPVRIDDLLKNIVDFLKTLADNKKQSLSLEITKDPLPTLTADPIALESIFGNLITNAINYTQEGGKIVIEVDLAVINIRVKVKDNGFGIEPKHLEKIFERFYRVKDDKTRYITGTGLGLPIVKGLVDSMGGIVDIESTPGLGSVFTVLLPV